MQTTQDGAFVDHPCLQPVATSGKSYRLEGRKNKPKPLPWVATARRKQRMVRRGFAAFKNHLSYLPFSGSALEQLPNELRDYATTKSSVHFSVDRPLPRALVKKQIDLRLAELAHGGR